MEFTDAEIEISGHLASCFWAGLWYVSIVRVFLVNRTKD